MHQHIYMSQYRQWNNKKNNRVRWFGVNTGYNVNLKCALEIRGVANISNGNSYAINNYTLNNGNLVIGDTTLNYGGADG